MPTGLILSVLKFIDFHKLNKWIEKIIAYPGIDKKELTQRKDYWLGGIFSLTLISSLTLGFWITHPEFKILLSYGLFMTFIFLLYPVAGIIIHRNLEGMMFVNQMLMIIGTFLCVLKLGGIIHSGGLILIGFFVVLNSLSFHKKKKTLWLFSVYLVTLILAWALDPYLTVAPEMTHKANVFLFIFNLIWVSAMTIVFILNFISQLVEFEHKEAKRLKEWDETKTKLYTNITHEFRTPLTVIQGMADLIRNKPGKWLQTGTHKIEDNSNILLNLVNQMLDLSKLEAGAMPLSKIQANIILCLGYLIESFQSLAESKKITLDYLPETTELIMDYDPDKIIQIVSNLVSNALKYTSPGDKVKLTTLIAGKINKKLEIRIRDSGMGIPEEHLPHIFDRFYRVESENRQIPGMSGTGLGLALTRELIKLLDGTIHVKSVYGEGTEFIVSLPVTNNSPLTEDTEIFKIKESILPVVPVQDEKNRIPDETTPTDKPRLLIVEDSQDVIEYLAALLDANYQIQISHDGKEGLKKALDIVPDIILSDVMMPEMDGIELLDKVKNDIRTSHIPVVILTAKADVASRLAGLERGADAYIAKPFDKKELIIQLERSVRLRKKLQERYATFGHLTDPQNRDFKIEDSFIKKIREFMLIHLGDETFSVKKLCYEVAMSRAQLYRKFKTLTDKSLFEYFLSLRLHEARKLLASSGMNVSEVAFQTGFKSLSHFSRVFTKEFGVNPSKI